MNFKRKIIGIVLLLIGVLYFIAFFACFDMFEQINDTICFMLTIGSVVLIISGIFLLFIKTPEEHFREEQIKTEEREKLSAYLKYKPYATYVILIANIISFVLINMRLGNQAVLQFAISKNDFEAYRLFTAMFMHANENHIIFNMIALYLCGGRLESLIGSKKYLVIYIVCGLCSSAIVALLSKYPCVGASGAIFGLFGCYLLIAFKNRKIMRYTFWYDLLPTTIINLIVTFVVPNISALAHIGGLVVGMIMYLLLCRNFILKDEECFLQDN